MANTSAWEDKSQCFQRNHLPFFCFAANLKCGQVNTMIYKNLTKYLFQVLTDIIPNITSILSEITKQRTQNTSARLIFVKKIQNLRKKTIL